MTPVEAFLILLAGVGAGTINTIVGSGTLITFPALLAFGIPPVVATMSNGIGLVPGNVSGTWGYRRELAGQWPRLRWQIPASVVGAVIGAWLLLVLPEDSFKAIVPVLLVIALVLVITQTRIQRWVRMRAAKAGKSETHLSTGRRSLLVAGTFGTGIYGGYFSAAQGILLIGIMGALLPDDVQRLNAAKNLLTLLVNLVSGLAFTLVAFDRVNWAAAGLIAVGSLIGGFIGAGIGRRLSPIVLRSLIVVLGIFAIYRIVSS